MFFNLYLECYRYVTLTNGSLFFLCFEVISDEMANNKSILNVILTAYLWGFIIGIISSLQLNVSVIILDTIEFDPFSLGFCSKMGCPADNMYMNPSLCHITSAAVSESVSLHFLPCSKCLYWSLVQWILLGVW